MNKNCTPTASTMKSLAPSHLPSVLSDKQNAMRKHILKSIEDGVMTVFPSSGSRHSKAEEYPVH